MNKNFREKFSYNDMDDLTLPIVLQKKCLLYSDLPAKVREKLS